MSIAGWNGDKGFQRQTPENTEVDEFEGKRVGT